MFLDRVEKPLDAIARETIRLDHGRAPASARLLLHHGNNMVISVSEFDIISEIKHGFDLRDEPVSILMISFIDNVDIASLHDTGFERLDLVAHAWREQQQRRVGGVINIDFILANADGFNENVIKAECVEDGDRVLRGPRDATQLPPARHAADEHLSLRITFFHANAIAEQGAPREWARGIDAHDANGGSVFNEHLDDLVNQRSFSHTGRTRNANDIGFPRVREDSLRYLPRGIDIVFRQGDQARRGAAIPLMHAYHEIIDFHSLHPRIYTNALSLQVRPDIINNILQFRSGPVKSSIPSSARAAASSWGITPPAMTSTSSMPFSFINCMIWGKRALCAPDKIERQRTSGSSWMTDSTIIAAV